MRDAIIVGLTLVATGVGYLGGTYPSYSNNKTEALITAVTNLSARIDNTDANVKAVTSVVNGIVLTAGEQDD